MVIYYFVIDLFCKYASIVPSEDKRSITTTNTFQKKLNESGGKPYKIWVDKGSEFYNKLLKS